MTQVVSAETGIVAVVVPGEIYAHDGGKRRLAECVEFLNSIPDLDTRIALWTSLQESLEQIARISRNRQEPAMLGHDSAPLSMGFSVGTFGGGVIFHGYGVGGGGYPTLAVTLDDSNGWQIHT